MLNESEIFVSYQYNIDYPKSSPHLVLLEVWLVLTMSGIFVSGERGDSSPPDWDVLDWESEAGK